MSHMEHTPFPQTESFLYFCLNNGILHIPLSLIIDELYIRQAKLTHCLLLLMLDERWRIHRNETTCNDAT